MKKRKLWMGRVGASTSVLICALMLVGCDGLFTDLDELSPPQGADDAGGLDDAGGEDDVGDDRDVDHGPDADVGEGSLPQVETLPVIDVAPDAVTLRGEIESLGDPAATDHGFCVGTEPEPEDCNALGEPEVGGFESEFDEFSAGSTYFVRAFVEAGGERYYGDDEEFAFRWEQIASEEQHSCGIDEEGRLWCWGMNSYRQLGSGASVAGEYEIPQRVGDDDDWAYVDVGMTHSCAIRDDRTLWCWGEHTSGALGIGEEVTEDISVPHQVGEELWMSVSAGSLHTCGVRDDHTLWCWGTDFGGKLGIGGDGELSDSEIRHSPELVVADADLGWETVAAGHFHTCAIDEHGRLWCWGWRWSQALGLPEDELGEFGDGVDFSVPELIDDRNWRDISVAGNSSCALRAADASLWCWGDNDRGQLGLGNDMVGETQYEPEQVSVGGGGQIRMVSMGRYHSCAIMDGNSTLWCWGSGIYGQLGRGDLEDASEPVRVGSGTDWSEVAIGVRHSCALRGDGQLECFGVRSYTQLEPAPVVGGAEVQEIAAGGEHGCAVDEDGSIWCWGRGDEGKLGVGDTDDYDSPQPIDADGAWSAVATSRYHSCAIEEDGSLWCWGRAINGQVGEGNDDDFEDDQPRPIEVDMSNVDSGSGWSAVSAGSFHSCALRDDGTLWCWGSNAHGKLGIGVDPDDVTGSSRFGSPRQVGNHSDWVLVSAGGDHSCGIRADHSLWCWGSNWNGELGIDSAGFEHGINETPQEVLSGDSSAGGWKSVAAGQGFSCAIDRDDELFCWGLGRDGRLGRSEQEMVESDFGNVQKTPAQIEIADGFERPTGWSAVSTGGASGCAIDDEGRMWCWGENRFGQLATGDMESRDFASPVDHGQAWTTLSVGRHHVHAVDEDDQAWSWGARVDGQLNTGPVWITEPTALP